MNSDNKIRCDICDIDLQQHDLENHLKGKKHQKALLHSDQTATAVVEDVQIKSEPSIDSPKIEEVVTNHVCEVCSVSVPLHGMDVHISGKKHKSNLLKQNQNREAVDKNVCKICDISVTGDNMPSHLNGKKHKKNVQEIEKAKKKQNILIIVSDYPASAIKENLIQYFCQFGKIKLHYFQNNSLHIQYVEPFSAEKALSTPHYFQDKTLTVKRFVPDTAETSQNTAADELDLICVANSLKSVADLDEQVKCFIKIIKPQFPGIQDKYRRICRDLEVTLRTTFPWAQVHAFGSTVTGLCLKDSDVDAFIQLPSQVLQDTDTTDLLRMARKALYRNHRVFNDICCIFKAKTPIVKCLHLPTGLRCDFNFTSMLGVCNTHLIRYYLTLDPKLTPLILIIKFWGKIHEFSGSQKLTNYALTMLIIFYLQNPPFNLPSVKKLQANCVLDQHGWNGGFKPLDNFHSEALEKATLLELIEGDKLLKSDFYEPTNNLTSDFDRYKFNLENFPDFTPLNVETTICLQDPFEHTRNLTSAVHIRVLEWFLNCCKQGVSICTTESNFLYNLFTICPKVNSVIKDTTSFQIRASGHLKHLYYSIEPTKRTVNALKKAWFETLNTFLLTLLTLVLKLDVEAEPVAAKQIRRDGQKDVHESIVDSIVFRCTGKYNLWEQRKSLTKDVVLNLPTDSSSLDREIALTHFIYQNKLKETETNVDFRMMVTAKTNPTLVDFQVSRVKGDKSAFHKLCVFLLTNFGPWFAVYSSEKSKAKSKKSP